MRGGLAACAWGLALLATMAQADPGHDLFTGQNPSAADGRIGRFACHSCHGRDGRGGVEGDVPAIAGPDLGEATDQRPAYDLARFQAAVTAGIDPTGRGLSRIMPRYDLSKAEVSRLWFYLQDLPRRQAQGITPDHVRFGVVIDPALPAWGARYLDAVRGALPSGTIHGRRVEVVALDDPVRQADTVVAALAMPPHRDELTAQITATGLPVIFALTALGGNEDASIERSFVPTDREVNGAIVAHLATTTARRIGISAGPARIDALTFLIRSAIPDAVVVPLSADGDRPDAVIDLDGQVPGDLPPPAILYRLASQARGRADAQRSFLVIEAPQLIALAVDENLHPLEAHAALAVRILVKVLTQAGRDLSRSRLLSAFGDTPLNGEHLDYARLPLNGSDHVAILEDLNTPGR
ncbi:hypothetical protein ACOI1H_21950 [Loktanella sp. DJP18]|uniref:cytochrome c/ABC transporter substrate-binding protein n=1 Tax=Loktanella sp. DJP18 TaxID=3409788 RepID=UPI003BB7C900